MDFKATLKEYQERVEASIASLVPNTKTRPAVLHEAMRYSLDAGGKRLRPCLVLAAHALFESKNDPMPAAVSIECMHTYSLIHDDLPCMDDSDLRRGKPSCHKQFDEETALLAGDALLTYSLWMLAHNYRETPKLANDLVCELGKASGSEHLIGGQMEDLLGERATPTVESLDFIHLNKTAALITCSLVMGLRLADASDEKVELIRNAGRHLGLAFQIIDDILDETSDAETMGKPVGADEENKKMTYPSLYGLEKSRKKAQEHTAEAIRYFDEIGGNNTLLIELAKYMEQRIH
ncbi:farnesyl diphosphate synthase [Rubellicoccus peritrichatus]|uniref:Polyprenyl synthetase family protein n=1 Tax=Rubellicoccus peritrichatus TaxID=3080537 RepID=A0AAQ3LAD6_9BACT|nr:farnesyl diphosphate synthase [Puniceicoccus sp. CR14]WOO39853.1 polyprenyl synthetase family protein [Puniceicoccus sp. CR14]